ncbi:aryl-sulfate sulfotransferase [Thalassotalea nanhaiensis]|uniref:Aryl-sulfate sulfotransferase n=1 Tax=Thalassotalea nanhaiensis TaxID=3065648 RepID=A0ABY9TJA5_9GAMM|nr:aryl-sulfate sulfotransferase [Colwelliaceae bacterium SQ345]
MLSKIPRFIITATVCLIIVACGGDDKALNASPTLAIHAPVESNELEVVELSAVAADDDGVISSYLWQQIAGTPVVLNGVNHLTVSFTAPEIAQDEILEFSLTVQDNDGAEARETVSLSVLNVNKLPSITIDAVQQVNELSVLNLAATASDEDGEIVSYNWQQVSGTAANLVSNTEAELMILLPNIELDELLTFTLTVTDDAAGQTTEEISILVKALTLAQSSSLVAEHVIENDPSSSIFISAFDIQLDDSVLESVSFSILAKKQAVASEIKATYEIERLSKIDGGVQLPIFGMYRGYNNTIELAFKFIDGSTKLLTKQVETETLIEPEDSPFNQYKISSPSLYQSSPSYDYLLMKTARHGPVIMDVDGNVRWQAYMPDNEFYNGYSSIFDNGAFRIALKNKLYTLELDGTFSSVEINHDEFTDIAAHHELSKGKTGYFVEVDANKSGTTEQIIESILLEVDESGDVINTWDFADILSDYMIENGDDPANFVRNGVDWFHMNSAIYSESDDSIIVSSRENFVIKIDYKTAKIKWLLGDESKHWYVNYPSLRTLSLLSNDTKPIGQHALSLVAGELLLFNDGQFSFNQPEEQPEGLALTSSPSAKYVIDENTLTASVSWEYDPAIYSDVCSSIYQDESSVTGDYLVNFAAVNRLNSEPIATIIQGVNEDKELMFEFQFETKAPCAAAWNSSIVYGLTDLQVN